MLYEITDVLSSVMLRATPSRVRWMSASPFPQLGESAEARRGEEKIWTELQPLSSFSAAPASSSSVGSFRSSGTGGHQGSPSSGSQVLRVVAHRIKSIQPSLVNQEDDHDTLSHRDLN